MGYSLLCTHLRPWFLLTAPLCASLYKAIGLTLHDLEEHRYVGVMSILNASAILVSVASSSCFCCVPLLCRVSRRANTPEGPLYRWLVAHPQQQHETQQLFSSSENYWFLWNTLACTLDQLHRAAGGWSGACSLEVSSPGDAKALGFVDLSRESPSSTQLFVLAMVRTLGMHYIILPGEQVLNHFWAQKVLSEGTGADNTSTRSGGGGVGDSGGRNIDSSSSSSSSRCSSRTGSQGEQVGGRRAGVYMCDICHSPGCLPQRPPGLWWLLLPPLSSSKGDAALHHGENLGETKAAREGGKAGTAAGRNGGEGVGWATDAPGVQQQQKAAAYGGCLGDGLAPTISQLHLVLNMLLLIWPSKKTEEGREQVVAAGAAATAAAGPEAEATAGAGAHIPADQANKTSAGQRGGGVGIKETVAAAAVADSETTQGLDGKLGELLQYEYGAPCWGWLLLLVALLQQAPPEAKQQLMQQEAGEQLLQLLYRVLLDEHDMEEAVKEEAMVVLWDGSLEDILDQFVPEGVLTAQQISCPAHIGAVRVSVVQLVLMVLQSLLLVVDPWQVVLEHGLDFGAAMEMREGKGRNWWLVFMIIEPGM